MLPRVAFITINFNSFFDTVELLESIDEDGVDLDFYILDNGSNLEDYNKLKKYLDGYSDGPIKVILLRSEHNLGFSKGNNFLLEKAGLDYDFYVIGNNDLVLNKNSITDLIGRGSASGCSIYTSTVAYYANKDIVWYGGGRESIEPRFKSRHLNKGKKIDAVVEGDQNQVSFASGAWMIISKNVFEKTYLFDPNMFFGEEDAEFCRRAKKKGLSILYVPDIVVYHKVGESANSRKRPELNLYHIQSKIYNVSKSYSVLFSLPYFFSFYVYQISLSILEKDKWKTIFCILKKIPAYYVKGILNKNN